MTQPLHTTVQDLLPLLERIATAQEAIAACTIRRVTTETISEGFRDSEGVIYCNVTKGNHDGWYRLQGESAITQQSAFCGRIVALEFNTVVRREKEVSKLYILMKANGKLVKFESGTKSMFTKSILAALATTTPDILTQPIEFSTYIKKLNTGDSTLMVAVRDSKGNEINCDWNNDSPWREIAAAAKDNVAAAVAMR